MLVAAYLVGGFLVASVYAVGMLRGRRDRYHRLGFLIPFTVAAIATPIQMVVGDKLARWVYNNEPMKFAAIELVPEDLERRARDAVRAPQLGRRRSAAASRSRARVVPLGPDRRHEHRRSRARHAFPTDERPTIRGGRTPSTSRGTSWSASARCCSCSRSGTWLCWVFRRDMPKSEAVPLDRRPAPASSSVHRDGSGLGRHRGRPPAVDRVQLHEGRGRRDRNTGVWITFLVVVLHLRRVGVDAILVLRA